MKSNLTEQPKIQGMGQAGPCRLISSNLVNYGDLVGSLLVKQISVVLTLSLKNSKKNYLGHLFAEFLHYNRDLWSFHEVINKSHHLCTFLQMTHSASNSCTNVAEHILRANDKKRAH